MSETIKVLDEFGVEVFRYEVPEGQAGFVGAVLEGVRLDGANLPGADFSDADLYWAGFFDANVAGASFKNACLRGADLKRARLAGANFEGADLSRDNLNGSTQLQGADLRRCNIRNAKFEGAEYDATTQFPDGFDPERAGMIDRSGVWQPDVDAMLGDLFDPEPEQWGLRGDPHLWRRMREFFRDTALPASPEILEALVRDAFQVLSGHDFDEGEDFYVEDFDTGGLSAGRISIRFWHVSALALLRKRLASEQRRRSQAGSTRDDGR